MQLIHDRRGQSVVIGTVILFGFLILALSLYQVQVVPQQNAQAEFEHFEDVRNDLVDLRAGILQAGSTDRPQYQTVRLGTSYSTRVFAINPPAPAGEIRTTDSYNVTIDPDSGDPVNVSTRFIEYRPGYNEVDRSPTWYDASVLYTDARDSGGGIAVIEGQELVDIGENVEIVAVQNEFRRSGTGRVTIELRPAGGATDDIPDGPLTVTIPTRLSEADWETKTNITEKSSYDGVTGGDDGVYRLRLDTTRENLTVGTVGVGEAPEDPTQETDRTTGSGSSLEPGTVGVSDTVLEFTMRNVGDTDVTIEQFAVDATGINSGITIDDANADELEIRDSAVEGLANRNGNPDAFDADGQRYDLEADSQADKGQYATISPNDGDVTAEFRQFSERLDNGGALEFTDSASNADVTVTFVLSDGSTERFYLRQS